MHTSLAYPYIILKLNFKKVIDSFSWSFLLERLFKFEVMDIARLVGSSLASRWCVHRVISRSRREGF